MLMGFREYARHRKVTLGAVQKAIASGRIQITAEKKIDSDLADLAWTQNTDASRVTLNAVINAAPSPPSAPAFDGSPVAAPADDDGVAGNDKTASEYREHRATREQYQALKQKLEYEQMSGQLINVDEAKRIAYTSFRAVRDSIMNVATRIKDQLAAETDAHACEALVEQELSAALAGIDIGRLLKEQDDG